MLKKVWRKRTFLCCWWEYELVQPLWRTVRRLLKKLKTELLLYDPAISLLGIYPEKTLIQKDMCTPVLICCCVQLLSHVWFFATPWTAASQAPLSSTVSWRVCSNACPLSQWCYLTISSSATPSPFCLQSFPASGFFQWVISSHWVATVLEFQLQQQSFKGIFRVGIL